MSTTELVGQDSPEGILHWLVDRVAREGIAAHVFSDLMRIENRLLYVPVFVESTTDAYEKAMILQNLEDAWNNREPSPNWQLFLEPAAK